MKKRIRTHTNPLNIRQRLDDIKINDTIRSYDYLDLEIGFGRGRFMSQYAQKHGDRFVVGVEVRKQMVEEFKRRYTIDNCLPIWGAGAICLEDVIPNNSVDRVFIFHPDPWFKKRHHKRRVVNHELLRLIQSKMVSHGTVYISTDVEELYEDMLNLCETYGNLEFIEDDPFWVNDYLTHWSMFSDKDQRSQYFLSFNFKEEV
ncbi:tRNA (guanosine(46)-N7)-methyltransferase TrmB [Candidatus Marinamargulisbacteria bacterium SCGC AG-343-K17]|nr:tRNA (guanosine(46)-N7)-methyltransferase TrmB [Candidatus Marinamargulisbacteria bacterium SCGC AG-343-K17]